MPDVVLTAGGTFSVSPAGLDVNSSTGEIDLSTGTEGSVYTITYVTSPGECGNEFELDITIDFLDDPGFGYGASSFCATGLLDPAFVNTPGGFFSSDPSTLSIDFLTGTIDLETGTVGESYTIKYLTPDGPCQDSSFVTITIDPNDDSSFSYIADTFCPFGTSLPDLIATPGGEFSILPAIGLPLDPSSGTLTLEGAIPGVYSITYQTPEGLCTSSSVFTVTIDSVVNASFGYSDTGFCQVGEAVPDVLNAGGVFSSVPGISIDPVSGIINLEASTTGGPYEIYYASPGCSETDTAYVTIFPNPVLGLDLITPVCIEDNAMLLGATPAGGTFSGEGVTGDLFNPALLYSGGLYTINYMYTDGNGCSSEINGSIEVIEHTVSAGIDVSIVEGTSTTLQAVGGIIYTWSPAEGLSCTGCASPTAQPLISTTYTVVSFDGFGCVASDTVRVTLVPFDDLTVFVPNAFTPNGDGSNDFLTGYGSDIEVIEVFQIYDRWGNTIWEGKQLLPGVENMGWDGSINGKSANPGVYAYKAIVRFTYGVSTIASGNVTLMR